MRTAAFTIGLIFCQVRIVDHGGDPGTEVLSWLIMFSILLCMAQDIRAIFK